MKAPAALLAVVVIAVVACTGSPAPPGEASPPAAATSATALAELLAADGLPCAGVATRQAVTHVAEEATCSIGLDDVIITTFRNADDRDRYLEASGNFTEQLSFDIDTPPRLVGPTWIVTTDTRATAEKIRAILGGELR